MAPLATWANAQNALKVAIFRLKIEKFSGEGAMPPPQTPATFPLHKSQRSFQHACFATQSYLHTHNSKFSNKQRILASKTL